MTFGTPGTTPEEKRAWRRSNLRFCPCCNPVHGCCLFTGEGQAQARTIAKAERGEMLRGLAICALVFVILGAVAWAIFRIT
jgi:hypothetical protein